MSNNNVVLSKAKVGKFYFIKNFSSNLSFYEKDRLLTYGFIEDKLIRVVRRSIFGNTFQVQVSGINLVIRKKEAKNIYLKDCNNES